MSQPDAFPSPFTLRDRLIQPDLNRITGPDGEQRIEPRVMRVLLALAAQPGAVLSRQRLLDEVWGDAVVGEEILTRAISELRRVFGDDPRRPAYIETIRQHGYRLVAPPVAAAAVDAELPTPTKPEPTPTQPSTASSSRDADPVAPRRKRPVRLIILAAVLSLAALVAWRYLASRPTPVAVRGQPPTAVPLTSFSGREWHPALSPDGTQVAYIWGGEDGRHPGIFVKQRQSESPLRLTAEPGWPAWPVWAPDGQRLAFIQTGDTASSVCLVPSLGGVVQRLHATPGLIEGLDWSPDASRLVFAARPGGVGPYRLYQLNLADIVVTALAAGSDPDASDLQPRFSPDGRQLAWIAAGPAGTSAIVLGDTGADVRRVLLSGAANLQGLAWTADGGGLVYAKAPAGRYSLWRVDLQDGASRWIPTAGEFAWNPAIARRTGELVYEQVTVDRDIWRVQVVGRDPWLLQTGPFLTSTRWEYEADISPDGARVVFVSARSGGPELWLADERGEQLQRLTHLDAPAITNPRWSPDGTAVACNVVQTEGTSVVIVAAHGGEPQTLVPAGGRVLFANWTHDGAGLLIGRDDGRGWQIQRVATADGAFVTLTAAGGLTAAEAPDGSGLYHTRPDRAGLWWQPAGAGEPELVIPGLAPADRRNWRLGPGWIAWIMRSGGAAFLMRHESASGQSSFLAELPGLSGDGLALAPAGEAFLYVHAGEAAGDLMLVPADEF